MAFQGNEEVRRAAGPILEHEKRFRVPSFPTLAREADTQFSSLMDGARRRVADRGPTGLDPPDPVVRS